MKKNTTADLKARIAELTRENLELEHKLAVHELEAIKIATSDAAGARWWLERRYPSRWALPAGWA